MPRAIREAGMALPVYLGAATVAGMFLWIVGDILSHGLGQVSWAFLVQSPMNAGRAGGIGPILISTALVLLVCLGTALPVALLCAMSLVHYGGGRLVRASLDVLAGVPSIVFGLFGAVLFGRILGLGFSILSGGLTLAFMVLPLLIRTTEVALANLPASYRMGASALGLGPFAVLFKVLLPPALPGIMVGLVLGIGRALAETAALIFTAGYVDRMPGSLFDSGRVLSIHIYDLSMNVPGGDANAYGSAAVLLALLLVINGSASWMSRRWLEVT